MRPWSALASIGSWFPDTAAGDVRLHGVPDTPQATGSPQPPVLTPPMLTPPAPPGAPGHATATGYRAPSWHRGPPGDAGYPARHAADPAPGQAVSRELLGDDLGLIDALQERIDRLDWEIRQRARSDPPVPGGPGSPPQLLSRPNARNPAVPGSRTALS